MEPSLIILPETTPPKVSMECAFEAKGNMLIVRKLPEDDRTAGGIVIPDQAKAKPVTGVVLSAGPGDWDDRGNYREMKTKVGEIVLFDKYTGIDLKHKGLEYTLMPETAAKAKLIQ
jgi:chaperonin GroES